MVHEAWTKDDKTPRWSGVGPFTELSSLVRLHRRIEELKALARRSRDARVDRWWVAHVRSLPVEGSYPLLRPPMAKALFWRAAGGIGYIVQSADSHARLERRSVRPLLRRRLHSRKIWLGGGLRTILSPPSFLKPKSMG